MNFSTLPSGTLLGKFLRYPLRLLPTELVVPVLRGPLRGSKWIVGSSLHGCWLGSFEYEKQRRVASELKPGSVFYDIGANVGLYSLLAGRLVTPGKIYAFEPLPRNVWYLRRHLELNRIENVEVFELAVSDRSGSAFLEETACRLMGRLAREGSIHVRTATLDSLLLEERISPPDVIKMDIEGAELLALRGASECIQRYRPVIFLATHGREAHQACCELLESWGYDCRLLDSTTTKDRGEVVAKFRG
jgi:FkbM family methyltransferase